MKCRAAWRTASAVPWNQSELSGVCSAASTSTKPSENDVQPIGLRDVAVERRRVELRQHEDALQPGVQAVADRDVDQPVLPADRHGRLRAHVGEREEPGAASAAEDQCEDVFHVLQFIVR